MIVHECSQHFWWQCFLICTYNSELILDVLVMSVLVWLLWECSAQLRLLSCVLYKITFQNSYLVYLFWRMCTQKDVCAVCLMAAIYCPFWTFYWCLCKFLFRYLLVLFEMTKLILLCNVRYFWVMFIFYSCLHSKQIFSWS